jgi:hypothetical protein
MTTKKIMMVYIGFIFELYNYVSPYNMGAAMRIAWVEKRALLIIGELTLEWLAL